MGIYIKGMEMPKDCLKCPFCLFDDGYWKCLADGSHADFGGTCRPSRCPLVPVPPHGDLIDRDPFVQFIKSHWDSSDQWFVEQLEARPTIIPAEEGET